VVKHNDFYRLLSIVELCSLFMTKAHTNIM